MNRFVVGLLMLSTVAYAAKWNYDPASPYGVKKWNTIFSDNCDPMKYPRQSPIDIKRGFLKYAPELGDMKLSNFDAKDAIFQAENNGHTVQFNINGNLESEGGPVGSVHYFPFQLHFHWGNTSGGHGSEHTILGKQHKAEMHIVHVNHNYAGFPTDQILAKEDSLLVLGVFIDVADQKDTPNQEFAKITEGTMQVRDAAGTKYNMTKGYINLSKLLPEKLSEYYTYPGGLTTPNCHGAVTWVVFKHAISIKQEQLNAFFTVKDAYGKPLSNIYRPPQPINGRIVRTTSMDDSTVTEAAGSLHATYALIMTVIFSRIFL